MLNTYGPCLALCIGLAVSAGAQSLEDKVSQSRRLQAQSMMGLDDATVDSLIREKRAGQTQAGRNLSLEERRVQTPDSLISGPELGPTDTLPEDSLVAVDSLGRKRTRITPVVARYEQRIFRSVDRSAFASSRGAVGRDYVLGPGDEVTVSLWGDKEKVYQIYLNPEGKLFMEGLGLVPLAGLNLNEAQVRLKERLARIYSGINRGTTHVDLSVGGSAPIKVFVLGEVKVPGGFVLTGNSGVLSALYFAQGPTDIGTVRNIKLTRGGRSIPLDLYEYLVHGRSLAPGMLRDGDVLYAGRADALVEIKGDVGRPATYELRKGEGVKELIGFAGKLNPTAAAHRMVLQRVFPGGRTDYLDLAPPEDYLSGKAVLELQDGDKLLVEKSTETTRNFLTVTGPVKYPGTYSSEGVRTVADLIARAGGTREDAFPGRVHVVRYRPDGSSKLFSYALNDSPADSIQLEPKDNVLLYSLKEMYIPDSVEVHGAVFNPGRYEYREGMSGKDLVMQAGGYLPQHEGGRLIVFRGSAHERLVEQIALKVTEGLDKTSETFILQPRDIVHVPIDPRWYQKEIVTLDGLLMHPGKYALLYPGERLSAVISRAGGFKEGAYVAGGRFYRSRDSVGRVGVDISRAMASRGSKADLSLVGGDSIFIPARLSTVKVMGEVGFETSILYQPGATVQYYIEKAGGFTRRSERDRLVVQYANGETSRDGYFNRKPDAGSAIYVPQGPEPQPINWVAGINALLGTLGVAAAVILSIQAIKSN